MPPGGILQPYRSGSAGSMNPRSWLFALVLASPLLFLIDFGVGPYSVLAQFYGFGHLAFFLLLSLGLLRLPALVRLPYARQALLVLLGVLVLGGGIELAQPFFGRGASWQDLGVNLLGGFIALLLRAPRECDRERWLTAGGWTLAGALAVLLFRQPVATLWDSGLAARQFPVISDFETPLQYKRWSNGSIERGMARQGEHALRVYLGIGQYSGTSLMRSFGDWRGYAAFAFSLYNPGPSALTITVSIRDQEHYRRGADFHDRFNRSLALAPGWNDVVIPMADIASAPRDRTLDLDRLSEVVIFATDLPAPRWVLLDSVRLVP